ncbi:sensor domain-containing protein [Desulfuromonas thiophila]|uniref:PAS domain S-box-containing protein/diguanylate cyclase (GGDEF) domain-containing protein n=1 Tax=Desulfuromonas thiophila TaxID=57664 RepID=A0A1G7DCP3_9BACT|nr:bifunctional diguanylate cyclase/phosphodiesterase [Desulfuromonas thiophila]SDE49331.1 PAS domain S-box-containing protein/diguanylate cyclase (GGDEF) domain-containing protein [Desulfuromonas thiophila]
MQTSGPPDSAALAVDSPASLERRLVAYVRAKIDQLLAIMGTAPLRTEELDDASLLEIDPIGIIAESVAQMIEHLHDIHDHLSLAHEELQAVFDATGAAIVVLDDQLRVHSCNRRAAETFALATGDVPLAFPFSAALAERLRQQEGLLEEPEYCHADQVFQLLVAPVRDRAGQCQLRVLAFNDITERRHNELMLQAAESRLSAIFNTLMAGILIIDPESHRIVDANPMAIRLIGDRRERIIGAVCHRYICPAQRGACPLTDLNQKLDNAERILIDAYGEHIPVLKTATLLELGGKQYILESFIDIRARKKAEDALRASEERYRALYAAMNEGLIVGELIRNAAGRAVDFVLHDVNPAACRILQYNAERLVGQRASSLYWQKEIPYLRLLEAVVADGVPRTQEISLRGRELHVSLTRPLPQRFAALLTDVTATRQAQRQIERLAYYDELTGLPNRVLIRDRLSQALAQARRQNGLVAVLAFDLDQFKKINDSLGNSSGDRLLVAVAERMTVRLRQGDSLARMGGDEFVIVLSGCVTQQDVISAAVKVLDLMAEPFQVDEHEIVCTASLGIALFPMDGSDGDSLLKNADTAMYQAKENGRNTYQFYMPEMNQRAFERLFLNSDLHRALDRGEFELYYQPQLRLSDGAVVGAEALLRWNHASKGQISPVLFIPLAEESDLILTIGHWVLEQACLAARRWYNAGYRQLRVAVNLSARQFTRSLPQTVAQVLRQTALPPELLELELTESLLMEKPEQVREVLEQLRELGTLTAIDDFGTGYSSLSYLKHFPLNRLKIDRSFVKDLTSDSDDAVIIEAIIALAHSLRLQVVAEGVETPAQLEFMRRHGCDDVQGYLLGRPMPADELMRFLQQRPMPTPV